MADSSRNVRVRMAPSPTGPFHIGRVRTALLNWLYARHHGGTFVLRIEDTDRQRSKQEYLQGILDSLRWMGLNWDEGPEVGGPYGPYFQMERLDTYRVYAQQLLDSGHAYRCYCTPQELEAQREQARAEKRAYRYPGTCRNLSSEQEAEKAGMPFVLRLKVPEAGITAWDDLVLGTISIANSELDDFVLVKSDGIPAYNFAVVIDDLTMEISDVIRGQDHVSNTPRQILIYQFLDRKTPRFGHVPLVIGMDRGKISARYGAEPVTAYGRDGYLPDALFNYLATLGASYEGDREIFDRESLIKAFDLSRIGRSSPVFDMEKLDWMNGVLIRQLPLADFVTQSLPFLQLRGLVSTPPSEAEVTYASRALALEQERVRTLAETPEAIEFFFGDEVVYDPVTLIQKKSSEEEAQRVLEAALETVGQVGDFTPEDLEPAFRALAAKLGLKTGVVFGTIRVALTGRTAAPPLFDTMAVLGRERVETRLRLALQHLATVEPARPRGG